MGVRPQWSTVMITESPHRARDRNYKGRRRRRVKEKKQTFGGREIKTKGNDLREEKQSNMGLLCNMLFCDLVIFNKLINIC